MLRLGFGVLKDISRKKHKDTVGNMVVDSAFGHKVSFAEDFSFLAKTTSLAAAVSFVKNLCGNKDDKSRNLLLSVS